MVRVVGVGMVVVLQDLQILGQIRKALVPLAVALVVVLVSVLCCLQKQLVHKVLEWSCRLVHKDLKHIMILVVVVVVGQQERTEGTMASLTTTTAILATFRLLARTRRHQEYKTYGKATKK